ncbi:MAG: hypothetical protein HXK91_04980 [Lachnospiraceae bacterium]|nr:hypothetical protein [Lachnospiraceae bacterium]
MAPSGCESNAGPYGLAYRMGIACAMESAHLMENEWFIENEGNDDT